MKYINEIINRLNGKKTYITSVLLALYTLLQAFSVIVTTTEQDQAVYGLLAAAFGIAVRDAIAKQSK